MAFPEDRYLELWLCFRNELKEIQIQVVSNNPGFRLHDMGTTSGRDALLEFLESIQIDCVIKQGEKEFTRVIEMWNPKRIVAGIENGFTTCHKITNKILNGEKLTEEERHTQPPQCVHLGSSLLTPEDGLKLAQEWFKAKELGK